MHSFEKYTALAKQINLVHTELKVLRKMATEVAVGDKDTSYIEGFISAIMNNVATLSESLRSAFTDLVADKLESLLSTVKTTDQAKKEDSVKSN